MDKRGDKMKDTGVVRYVMKSSSDRMLEKLSERKRAEAAAEKEKQKGKRGSSLDDALGMHIPGSERVDEVGHVLGDAASAVVPKYLQARSEGNFPKAKEAKKNEWLGGFF